MNRDHCRERKTGPCFPLQVARCRVHRRAFTVYPPGYVPYGRQGVAPADVGGGLLRIGTGEPAAGRPAWEQTVFVAAVDAAASRTWARSSPSRDEWRRRTQGRWLALCATLLGLVGREREQLAERLHIATLDLIEQGRRYQQAPGLVSRAQVIMTTLALLPIRRSLCDELLVCGAIAGLWGRPSRWDPGGRRGGVLRPL